MFTLEYINSETEQQPEHDSNICYYVLKGDQQFHVSLSQNFSGVTYEWWSDCGEVSEYYYPEKEGEFNIGDVRKATNFVQGERESHEYVRLTLCLDGQPVWRDQDNEDTAILAWNYTHEIQHEVNQYQEGNYFPAFDINNLLRTGIIEVIDCKKRLIPEGKYSVGEYYQVVATMLYKGKTYQVKMAQDDKWKDDDWTDIKIQDKIFGKVDVFQWELIKEERQ